MFSDQFLKALFILHSYIIYFAMKPSYKSPNIMFLKYATSDQNVS